MAVVVNDGGKMKLCLTDRECEEIKVHEYLDLNEGSMMALTVSVLEYIIENRALLLESYKDRG